MESSNVVVGVIVATPVTKTIMNDVNVATVVHGNSSIVPPIPVLVAPAISYAKPFSHISKFKIFNRDNFKRWQKKIFSILDIYEVAFALINHTPKRNSNTKLLGF